jgi:6-methylsalicylate decarboxylase
MTLTVDFHHHVMPDFYWQASNEGGEAAGGITPPRWSLEGALAYLDAAEIDVAVASISTPGVHFGDDAVARELARRTNEYLAELVRDRPDRFAALAAIPLPDVEGALDAVAYALDDLGLDGVSLMTNAAGIYMGDDRFDAMFAELQRRKALVFVHPTASPDPIAHTLGLPDALLDYPVDTSRAIAKLHYSNTFARTPDVKYVFSHAGGTIPFVASRFGIVDQMGVIAGGEERGPIADTLHRLHWDTASAFSDPVLTLLRSVAGLDNVVFGTDYPYPADEITIAARHQLQTTDTLSDTERDVIFGGAAARLIPRLAAPSLTELARRAAAALDAGDVPALAGAVTDDVRLQFASQEPTIGKEPFVAALRASLDSVAGFRHEILNAWEVDGAVVLEMLVHYERHDGSAITLPCVNVFRFAGERISDYRVHMDIAPVYV